MYVFQDIDLIETENRELNRLVEEAMVLVDSFEESSEAIVRIMEQGLPLALKEKEWYLYFEFYNLLFLQSTHYGNPKKTVKYAEPFMQDCIRILPDAMEEYAGTNIAETVLNCFSSVVDAYKSYHQITDEKLEEFLSFYEKTAKQYGQNFTYWRSVLEYGLDIAEPETAKRGYVGIKKYAYDGSDCYVCIMEEIIGYHVMTEHFDLAKNHIKKLLNRQGPKKYRDALHHCPASNGAIQYQHYLDFCARFGYKEEYRLCLEEKVEEIAQYKDSYGLGAETAYHLAVSGRFPAPKKYLTVFAKDVAKTESNGLTYYLMRSMMMWHIYFMKLNQSGEKRVKILSESAALPPEDKEGKRDTAALAEWCENKADELGMKFAKARRNFDYEGMKENIGMCAEI